MTKADDPDRTSTGGVTPGLEDAPAPGPVRADGQHESYWVLTEYERAKGFTRPIRLSYVHSGHGGPKHQTRSLTDEERERHAGSDYALYEPYPESEAPKLGRFWTNQQLSRATGCGVITTMSAAIAETYARDPKFYGATFCAGCKEHYPVGEFRWVEGGAVTEEVLGS